MKEGQEDDLRWMSYLSSDDSMLGEDDPFIPEISDSGDGNGVPPTSSPPAATATSIALAPDRSPTSATRRRLSVDSDTSSQGSQSSQGSHVYTTSRPRVSFMRRTTTGLREGKGRGHARGRGTTKPKGSVERPRERAERRRGNDAPKGSRYMLIDPQGQGLMPFFFISFFDFLTQCASKVSLCTICILLAVVCFYF